jgi:LysR family transcriptional regulator, regulator of gene expression of beta-lactamase
MAEAASQGVGVALVPAAMFRRELISGRLARPFRAEVAAGSYWLTWLKSKQPTFGMLGFRDWLVDSLRSDKTAMDPECEPDRGSVRPRPG